VVFIFLWNLRTTIIAAIAIPTSIIGAFSVMAALDFSLNQMTMLALTLMVGVVIDDAIVVLENIYRFVEEKGMHPFHAAIEGTREIGLAVMATTLSLLAVFLPVGFMAGIVGRFMSSFGLTAAAAIAISLLVSFTLTPMLAARWIRPLEEPAGASASGQDARHGSKQSRFYQPVDRAYTRMLEWSMAHRAIIVAVSVLTVLSIVPLFLMTGVNFLPEEDESQFEVTVRAPEGTGLAATQSVLERIARDVRGQLPGVESTLTIAGFGAQQVVNSGTVFVRLTPLEDRDVAQSDLIVRTREIVRSLPKDVSTSVQPVAPVSGGGVRTAAVQYAWRSGPRETGASDNCSTMRNDPNSSIQTAPYPESRSCVEIDRSARGSGQGPHSRDPEFHDGGPGSDDLQPGQSNTTSCCVSGEFRRDSDSSDVFPWQDRGTTVPLAWVRIQPGPGTIERLNRQRQVI
jgi:HAE1 family hydrophobic/amphiphilic exporter-1